MAVIQYIYGCPGQDNLLNSKLNVRILFSGLNLLPYHTDIFWASWETWIVCFLYWSVK